MALKRAAIDYIYIVSSFRFYKTITPNFRTLAHCIIEQTLFTFIKLSIVSANLVLVL